MGIGIYIYRIILKFQSRAKKNQVGQKSTILKRNSLESILENTFLKVTKLPDIGENGPPVKNMN